MNDNQIVFDAELEAEFQAKFAACAHADRCDWIGEMSRLFTFLAVHRLSVRFVDKVIAADQEQDGEE